ncbi:hypothetical protein [Acidithiobacillus ferrianus]|uniref:hypothetical protein n=1 Tax=Acidithiobacillus ferrianus TaxID=2678518 RepID=UPI0034E3F8E4
MRKTLIKLSLATPPTKGELAEIRARFTRSGQLAAIAEYGLLMLMCVITVAIITHSQGRNTLTGILGVALLAVPYAIAEQFARNFKHSAQRGAENLDYVEVSQNDLSRFMQRNDLARHYIQSVRDSGRQLTLMELKMLRFLACDQKGEQHA